MGFLPDDIIQEWQRGSKLRCAFCKEIYATVGCCQKLCLKTYHLPCGIKNGAISEYSGNFDSYCPNHKHRRKRGKQYVLTDLGLVPERVDEEAGDQNNVSSSNKGSSKAKSKPQEKYASEKTSERQRLREKNTSKVPDNHKSSTDSPKPSTARHKHGKEKKKNTPEETPKRTIRKPKLLADYDTTGSSDEGVGSRRSRRQRKKVEPLSDIYTSAKDELEKILKSKYESIENTFEDLSGKRRNRESVNSRDSDEDYERKHQKPKPRRRRRASQSLKNFVEVNTEASTSSDDERSTIKDEETIANIEHFLGEMEKDYQNSPKSTIEERDPLMDDSPSKAGII